MQEGGIPNASVLASSTTGAALASSAEDADDSSSVDSPELLRSCDNPDSANAIDSLWSSGQLTASHTCLVLTEGLQPADFVHLATNAPHSFTYVASSADAQRTTYMCHETAASKALILLYRQPRISKWQQGADPTH